MNKFTQWARAHRPAFLLLSVLVGFLVIGGISVPFILSSQNFPNGLIQSSQSSVSGSSDMSSSQVSSQAVKTFNDLYNTLPSVEQVTLQDEALINQTQAAYDVLPNQYKDTTKEALIKALWNKIETLKKQMGSSSSSPSGSVGTPASHSSSSSSSSSKASSSAPASSASKSSSSNVTGNPTGTTQVTTAQLQMMEQYILSLVNNLRSSVGVGQLTLNQKLLSGSRTRATESLTRFEHVRLDGSSWSTILTEVGYTYSTSGENLVSASTGNIGLYGNFVMTDDQCRQMGKYLYDLWVGSKGHYENMVRGSFTETGVGVSVKVSGTQLVFNSAELFGAPR